MSFPSKIKIPSDNTELELVEEITQKGTKEITGKYKYTKAQYFLGTEIYWKHEAFEKLVKKGIIAAI